MTKRTLLACVWMTAVALVPWGHAADALADRLRQMAVAAPEGEATLMAALQKDILSAAGDAAKRAGYEEALLASLDAPGATDFGIQFVCRQLAVIGSARSVPRLAVLLQAGERSAESARFALTAISGPEAESALVAALGRSEGLARRALVQGLGFRRAGSAVPALAPLAKANDPALAEAAVAALGRIATPAAAEALLAATTANRAEALVECGFGLAGTADVPVAARFLPGLADDPALRLATRTAAVRALLQVAPDQGLQRLGQWLDADQPAVARAAVSILNAMPAGVDPGGIIAAHLPAPSEETTLLLLAAAGTCRLGQVLPAVMKLAAAGPEDSPVRGAAIRALGQIPGTGESVRLLTDLAATGPASLRGPAFAALVDMPGEAAEAALAEGLRSATGDALRTVIRAAGDRGLRAAVPALLALAGEGDETVRQEAFKALRATAGSESYGALIRLARAAPPKVQSEAVRAVIRVGREVTPERARREPYLAAIREATGEVRLAFVTGLAEMGGADSLATLKDLIRSRDPGLADAAIRALAKWEGVDGMDLVLDTAAAPGTSAVHRVLLMRAFSRLLDAAAGEPVDVRLSWCRKALDIGLETEAQRLLIQVIGSIESAQALELVERAGAAPELQADAASAAARIKQHLLRLPGLSASHGQDAVGLATDANAETRWTTQAELQPGMWLQIDMHMTGRFVGFTLDTRPSPDDWPPTVEVFVAASPDDLGQPVMNGPGAALLEVKLPEPKTGRYLRIVNTGTRPGKWWSVHELSVDFDPMFPETPLASASVSDLLASGALVTAWDLAGPFTAAGRTGADLFDVNFGPERGIHRALWRRLSPDEVGDGTLDLLRIVGGYHRAVYLRTDLVAERDQEVTLGIGSDDGVKVWVNGALVHANNAFRPVATAQDKVKVSLHAGSNPVLVKVNQVEGGWGASLVLLPVAK